MSTEQNLTKKENQKMRNQPAIPRLAASITNCAFEHHIFGGRRYVSKKRPIYSSRAHYGCPGLPPWRRNLLGDLGGQRERRPYLRSEVALEAFESGLGRNEARQERSERACASSPTDHAVGHIPCQCGTPGVCDSFVPSRKKLSGQLQRQGVHGGGSFSSPVQLREIARENNAGQSDWADPGKRAVTFFDFNCADNKNNKSRGD